MEEAATRGRAGLIKDKVSLRSHFGLQTEGNICVNQHHGQATAERNAKRNRKKGGERTRRQYEYAYSRVIGGMHVK